MAKRGDPAVLRQVVSFLRSQAQMTQARFGKESRVDQALVSRFELGLVAPPEEALRRMAPGSTGPWSSIFASSTRRS
jgi:transcriptional regulator with XRE-family HTH domain